MHCDDYPCGNRAAGMQRLVDCLACRLQRDRQEAQQKVAMLPRKLDQERRKAQARLDKLRDEVMAAQSPALRDR